MDISFLEPLCSRTSPPSAGMLYIYTRYIILSLIVRIEGGTTFIVFAAVFLLPKTLQVLSE